MRLLLELVFVCACLGLGHALKCYTCHSDAATNCGDEFYADGIEMPSCPNDMDQGVCTKTKRNDEVARGCGLKSFCGEDVSSNGCHDISGTTTCCCTTDGCNSATKRRIDYVILTSTTLLHLVLWGSACFIL